MDTDRHLIQLSYAFSIMFRIRGLLPQCEYTLQLKDSPELPGLKLLDAPDVLKVSSYNYHI